MRKIRGLWCLVALVAVAGCIPDGAGTVAADLVPDPTYRPGVGDRAVLFANEDGGRMERLPLLKDVTSYDIFVRSQTAGDGDRLLELETQGWLQWTAPGTRVIVIAMQDRNHTGAHTASQVQVADDGHKNQTFWTPSDYITRLIRKPTE